MEKPIRQLKQPYQVNPVNPAKIIAGFLTSIMDVEFLLTGDTC
jgi:hypothetical protein